jgi:hypothetical protein
MSVNAAKIIELLDCDIELLTRKIESLTRDLEQCKILINGCEKRIPKEYNNKAKKKLIHYTLPTQYKKLNSIRLNIEGLSSQKQNYLDSKSHLERYRSQAYQIATSPFL